MFWKNVKQTLDPIYLLKFTNHVARIFGKNY